MPGEDILEGLKRSLIALDDQELNQLLKEGLQAGMTPMEMITDGLRPGLNAVNQQLRNDRIPLSDWVLANQILDGALDMLFPLIEADSETRGEVMVIGAVMGDPHRIGKQSVSHVFTKMGYKVIDIGERVPASKFVEAVKEHKASIVAASAGGVSNEVHCRDINQALVDAGIREEVIYIIGGGGMTQESSERSGADCYAEDALDALNKVKLIRQRKGI